LKTGVILSGLLFIAIYSLPGNAGVTRLQIDGLRYAPASQKISIVQRLVAEKNRVYLPEIGALLDDPSREVRSQAASALLELGDITCLPFFKKGLSDDWWQVRLYSCQGLVRFGDSSCVTEFLRCLDDSYWQVRYYGACGLSKFGDEEVIEPILNHLKDSKVEVLEELLWALTRLFWRDAARAKFKRLPQEKIELVSNLLKNPSVAVRLRTIWALESSQDERVIPFLVAALEDKELEVCLRSLWALERLKATDARFAIESQMEKPSVKLKLEAIKTLTRLKAIDTVDGLLRRLLDEKEDVRIYSLWALEKIKDPVSYPEIVARLGDSSRRVREYAVYVIESMKDQQFIPVLENFITSEDVSQEARVLSFQLLGKIGGPETKEFLMEMARSEDKISRAEALKAFFSIDRFDSDLVRLLTYAEKNDSAKEVRQVSSHLLQNLQNNLIEYLTGNDAKKRQKALEVLPQMMEAPQAVAILKVMGKSEYPEVREALAQVVAVTGTPVVLQALEEMMKEPNVIARRSAAVALGVTARRQAAAILKKNLSSEDQELQVICAWALARLGEKDGRLVAVKGLNSFDPVIQKKAAETLGYLGDTKATGALLKAIVDCELEVKAACAWALARLGETKGVDLLVRLSLQSVEPVRTQAERYLQDRDLPVHCQHLIPVVRNRILSEQLGMKEAKQRKLKVSYLTGDIIIDGSDSDRAWKAVTLENTFIVLGPERVPADIQTKVSFLYDEKYLYFLCVCDDPDAEKLTRFSRDFVSVAVAPQGQKKQWYQFVVHPFNDIRYSYIWKFYKDDEPERQWFSSWETMTGRQANRWLVEAKIPLAEIGVKEVTSDLIFLVNVHRESSLHPLSTFSGRIDNEEQFSLLVFEKR